MNMTDNQIQQNRVLNTMDTLETKHDEDDKMEAKNLCKDSEDIIFPESNVPEHLCKDVDTGSSVEFHVHATNYSKGQLKMRIKSNKRGIREPAIIQQKTSSDNISKQKHELVDDKKSDAELRAKQNKTSEAHIKSSTSSQPEAKTNRLSSSNVTDNSAMESLIALTNTESADFIQTNGTSPLCTQMNFGQVNGIGQNPRPDAANNGYVNSCVDISNQSANDVATSEYLQKHEEEELLQAFAESAEVAQGIAQALDVDSLTPSFVSEQSFELSVADVDLEPEDRPHCRFATKSNDTAIDNGNRTQNCDESLLMTARTTDNELAIELPANNISQQEDIQVPPTGIPIPIDTGMVVEVMEMEEGRGSELVSLNPPNETIDFGYRSYAHNFGADAVIEKESDAPNLTNDEQETDGKSTCLLVAVSESQYTVHSGYSPKTKQAPCPKTQPKVTTACQKAKKVKSAKASPSKLSPSLRSSISSKSQSVPNCSVKSPKSSTSNEIQLEMVKKSNICVNKSLEVVNVNSPNKTSPQKNKPCDSSNDISIVIPDKPTKTTGKRTAKVNVSHAKIAISKGKILPEKAKKSRKSKPKSEESGVKPPKAKKVKQSVDIMETTARCKGSRKKKKSLPVSLGLSKLNPLVVAGVSASKKTKKSKSKTNKKSDSCAVVVSSSSKSNSLKSKSLPSPKSTKSKPKTKSSTLFPKEKGIKVKGCKTKLKKKMGLCVRPLPVALQLPMNSPTENSIPPVLEIVRTCKVPKKKSKSKKSEKKSKSGRAKFGRAKVPSSTIVHTDGLLQVATKLNRKSKNCKLGKKEKNTRESKSTKLKKSIEN